LDVFKAKRLEKNVRLASLMRSIGYQDLSDQILNDPSIQSEQEFNVTKAWIEYINRLIGVVIGFLVFLNMISSFSFKEVKWIPIVGIFIFILTGFQGWVGSLVVSTNLLKGFITFHMLLALLIVALLIWMRVRAMSQKVYSNRWLFILTIAVTILFLPQLLFGTEVRHIVDGLIVNETDRSVWIQNLSFKFLIHRSYSWLILIGSAAIFYMVRSAKIDKLNFAASLLLGLVVATAIIGIIMSNFSFPIWTQPLHLLFATGIFSMLFYLVLRLKIS
jgi:cytochrome c oxidase assembly protein subunit 15